MKNKILTILFIALIFISSLVGCEKEIATQSVSLDKSEIVMEIGEKVTLTATVTPDNATDKSLTWSVADTTIATVSESGEVTAVSAGETTLTVKTTSGDKTATCSIKVNEAEPSQPSNLNLVKNYKFQIGQFGEKVACVGDTLEGFLLSEDSFYLTLNFSDNTCLLKYITFTYVGTFTLKNDTELTLSVSTEYEGQQQSITLNGEIRENTVSILVNNVTAIILQDVEFYQPPQKTVYKGIAINEIYGIGDVCEIETGKWEVLSEDSFVLNFYTEFGRYTLNTPFSNIYGNGGTYTQEDGYFSLYGNMKLDMREDFAVLNMDNGTFIKMVEESETSSTLSQEEIVGSYSMLNVLKSGVVDLEGYDCDLELNGDLNFTLNYVTPTESESFVGTWSYNNAGEITLNAPNLPERAQTITVSEYAHLGIWVGEDLYFSLGDAQTESIIGTYEFAYQSYQDYGYYSSVYVGDKFNAYIGNTPTEIEFTSDTLKIVILPNGHFKFQSNFADGSPYYYEYDKQYSLVNGEYLFEDFQISSYYTPKLINRDTIVCTCTYGDTVIVLRKSSPIAQETNLEKLDKVNALKKYSFLYTKNRGTGNNARIKFRGESPFLEDYVFNKNTLRLFLINESEAYIWLETKDGLTQIYQGTYVEDNTKITFTEKFNYLNLEFQKNGDALSCDDDSIWQYLGLSVCVLIDESVEESTELGKYQLYALKTRETSNYFMSQNGVLTYTRPCGGGPMGDEPTSYTIRRDYVIILDEYYVFDENESLITSGTYTLENGNIKLVCDCEEYWCICLGLNGTIEDNLIKLNGEESSLFLNSILKKVGTTVLPEQVPELN